MKHTLRLPLAAVLVLSLAACGDDSGGSGGATGSGGASSQGGGATTGDPQTSSTSGTTTSGTTTSSAETSSGTGGEGGSGSVTTGQSTGTGGTGTGGSAACDGEGFEPFSQDAGDLGDFFIYLALSAEAAPADDLSIEIYSDIGTAGSRTVLEENYSVCDPCVIMRLGCDENFDNCSQTFLANTGSIDIESFEGSFVGQLSGVELIEVTIGEGAVSTPVPGGDVWCLDGYVFEAEIQ